MVEHDVSKYEAHWIKTRNFIWVIFVVWAGISFVPPIFAGTLNKFSFLGIPLGYWISAQVALLTFITLLVINALQSDKIDREFDLHEEEV